MEPTFLIRWTSDRYQEPDFLILWVRGADSDRGDHDPGQILTRNVAVHLRTPPDGNTQRRHLALMILASHHPEVLPAAATEPETTHRLEALGALKIGLRSAADTLPPCDASCVGVDDCHPRAAWSRATDSNRGGRQIWRRKSPRPGRVPPRFPFAGIRRPLTKCLGSRPSALAFAVTATWPCASSSWQSRHLLTESCNNFKRLMADTKTRRRAERGWSTARLGSRRGGPPLHHQRVAARVAERPLRRAPARDCERRRRRFSARVPSSIVQQRWQVRRRDAAGCSCGRPRLAQICRPAPELLESKLDRPRRRQRV
jgi:hypothetical protein